MESTRTLTYTFAKLITQGLNRSLEAFYETDPLGNVLQSRCEIMAFGPEEPPGTILRSTGLTRPQIESCREIIRRYAVDHLGVKCGLSINPTSPWP